MKKIIPRELKVSKTDVYAINIALWLASEEIVTLNVVSNTGLTTIGSTNVEGSKLKVLLTGVSAGLDELHFEYTTATRSDCSVVHVKVVDGC